MSPKRPLDTRLQNNSKIALITGSIALNAVEKLAVIETSTLHVCIARTNDPAECGQNVIDFG